MRLKRLQITNCCQHESLDWQFSEGLVGVFGPNGSGKSNALNVCCYAGLTNDYSRHAQGKSGLIRQQAAENENSKIELSFTHDEHQFTVIRSLQNPVKHVMKREGQKDLTKANEIQNEIENVLGISRRLIDSFIFVGQGDLFAFLSATAADRAKSFAHLCNTTHAEQCWELLGEQITADLPLVQTVDDNRDEIRSQIGEYKTRLKANEADLTEARKGLLSKGVKEQCEVTSRNWGIKCALEEELPKLTHDESSLLLKAKSGNSAVQAATKIYEDALQATEGDSERRDEIIATLSDLRARDGRYKQKQSLEEQLEHLVRSKAAAGACPEPDKEDAEVYRRRISSVEKLLHDYAKLLDCVGLPKCPTCGTSCDKLEDKIEEAKRDKPVQLKHLEKYRLRCAEIEKAARVYDRWVQQNTSFETQIETAKRNISQIPDADSISKEEVVNLQSEQADIDGDSQSLEGFQRAKNAADTEFATAKAKHQSAKKALAEKKAQLAKLDVDQQAYEEAEDQLASHRTANNQVAAAKAAIAELEKFIDSRKKEIERVTQLLERSVKAKSFIAAMQDVRDEVMHRDKLPRVVHRDYLLDMEEDVNETLLMFDSPFNVRATENVEFIAHFQNGTEMPAIGLSGGQKVTLAMAYRLTVNSLFASQVGMMILDEPTDGLDADNRRLAAEVFQELGKAARSRGHQVIIITHDEALERVFDQKFILKRPV